MHGLTWFTSFAFLAGIFMNLTPCLYANISARVNKITYGLKNRFYQRLIAALLVLVGSIFTMTFIAAPIAYLSQRYPLFFQTHLFLDTLSGILSLSGLLTLFNIKFPTPKKFASFKAQGFIGALLTGLLLPFLSFPNCGWFFLGVMVFALVLQFNVILLIFLSLLIGLILPIFIFLLMPKLTTYIFKIEKWPNQATILLAFTLLIGAIFFSQAFIPKQQHFWIHKSLEVSIIIWALYYLVRTKILINRSIPAFVLGLYVLLNFSFAQPISLKLTTPYSKNYLQYALLHHRPVLIIFTADWCIDCTLQERYVYKNPEVYQLAKKTHLIPLAVDMTHRTPENEQLLKKYGGDLLPYAVLIDRNGKIVKHYRKTFNIKLLTDHLLK